MFFIMKVMRKIVVGLVFLLGFVINFHFGNNNVSADNIDRYIAYVGQSQDSYGMTIYVQNLSTGKVDVAYCINESKKLPYLTVYNRFDATSERLMALDNPRVDRKELPDIIKRIIYNGYPLNATKLQGKLSNGDFRRLTQLAIWYYSDSYNVNELTQEEKMAYNELIRSVSPVPVNLNLNIYVKGDGAYQDLLGTSFGQLPEHPQFSSSSSVSSSSSSKPSSSSVSSSSSSVTKTESTSSSSSSSSEQSSSSSSEISSVSSVATSISSSNSINSEKGILAEISSTSSKKELVSKKDNSTSVKVDKKKDLPQTGEKHIEVLLLSILGCIVLAGSLWIFERKYR